ncbi:hypothetical protein BDZ89DRAFT_919349, partial [Hymenopellis radicata]
DCRKGNCQPTIVEKEMQEHEKTDRDTYLISHSDDDHFVISMSGLHNFSELCRALPQELTKLKPLVERRIELHKEAAAQARNARNKK